MGHSLYHEIIYKRVHTSPQKHAAYELNGLL